jgi:hypothetical protein
MKRLLFIPLAFAVALACTQAAPFQNLDFESATLVPIPGDFYNRIYFDSAFRGWTGYVGNVSETSVLTNSFFLCCSAVTLSGQTPELIEGSYSALLHAARSPYTSAPADTAIAQTGLIPIDAQSLLFRAQIYGAGGTVTLGSEPLSLTPVLTTSDYVLYGADIRPWAGQEVELRFTALSSDDPLVGGTMLLLDSIQFSTTPVPEPSTFALFAVGGVLGWFCWRRKRR